MSDRKSIGRLLFLFVSTAAIFFLAGAYVYRARVISRSNRFESGGPPESVDPGKVSAYTTAVLPARYLNMGPTWAGEIFTGTCSSTPPESKHCFVYSSRDGVNWRLLEDFSDGIHTEVPIVFPCGRGLYATLHPDPVELWRSADGGDTWSKVFSHPTERSIYCLAESEDHLFLATWPEGSIYRSADGIGGWECVFENAGNGFFSMLARPNAAGEGEDIIIAGSAKIHRSKDGGDTWTAEEEKDTGPVRALLADTDGMLYAVGDRGLLLSADGGESWRYREADLVRDHLCHFTVLYGGYIYMGGDTGIVFRSSDGGETWENFFELPQPFDPKKRMNVRGITAESGRLYIGTSHYLFAGEPEGHIHRLILD